VEAEGELGGGRGEAVLIDIERQVYLDARGREASLIELRMSSGGHLESDECVTANSDMEAKASLRG
jgi:hypothetical protein